MQTELSLFFSRLSLSRVNIQLSDGWGGELVPPDFDNTSQIKRRNVGGASAWLSLLEHSNKKRTAETAIACWGILCEFDNGERYKDMQERFNACQPSYVLHSGRGDHVVWIIDKKDREEALLLQRAISKNITKKFGGDQSAVKSAPSSRVPFFLYARDGKVQGGEIAVTYIREAFDDVRVEELAEFCETSIEDLYENNDLKESIPDARPPPTFATPDAKLLSKVRADMARVFNKKLIENKGRNCALFAAGNIYAKYSIKEIDQLVPTLNQLNSQCTPPLSERELNGIISNCRKNAYKYVKQLPPPPPPQTKTPGMKIERGDIDHEISTVENRDYKEYQDNECVWVFRNNRAERLLNICPTIDNIFCDEDSGERFIDLRLKQNSEPIKFPATMLLDSRKVIGLANNGVSVSSLTARDICGYFDAKIADFKEPIKKTYSKWGWHEKEFWIAEERISKDRASPSCIIAQDKQIMREMAAAGNTDNALSALSQIIADPACAIMISASLSALLLSPLQQQGYTIHQIGKPQSGKSILSGICASIFGGQVLRGSWNCTEFAFENQASFMPDFPQILDDSDMRRAAIGSKSLISNLLYIAANGVSRKIGSNGGNRESKKFRTVIVSNGVNPISEEAEQAGAMSRVIETRLLPSLDIKVLEAAQYALLENQGHVVRAFARKAAKIWDNVGLEREIFNAKCAETELLLRNSGDVSAARHAKHMQLIDRAYQILVSMLNITADLDIVGLLSSAVAEAAQNADADVASRDIEIVLDELLARDAQIKAVVNGVTVGSETAPPAGWIGYYERGCEWVYIRPSALRSICKTHGLVSPRIVRSMVEKGICKPKSHHMRFDGFLQRYYLIKLS